MGVSWLWENEQSPPHRPTMSVIRSFIYLFIDCEILACSGMSEEPFLVRTLGSGCKCEECGTFCMSVQTYRTILVELTERLILVGKGHIWRVRYIIRYNKIYLKMGVTVIRTNINQYIECWECWSYSCSSCYGDCWTMVQMGSNPLFLDLILDNWCRRQRIWPHLNHRSTIVTNIAQVYFGMNDVCYEGFAHV